MSCFQLVLFQLVMEGSMNYLLTVGCACNDEQLINCFEWIKHAAGDYSSSHAHLKNSLIEFEYASVEELKKALENIHKLSLPQIETTAIKVRDSGSYEIIDVSLN